MVPVKIVPATDRKLPIPRMLAACSVSKPLSAANASWWSETKKLPRPVRRYTRNSSQKCGVAIASRTVQSAGAIPSARAGAPDARAAGGGIAGTRSPRKHWARGTTTMAISAPSPR
jgi:hypothetical protein